MGGTRRWRVGVAGVGTVGGGLLELLAARPDFAPAGGVVEVAAVSGRRRERPRRVDVSAHRWVDDPVALAGAPDLDIFVELIGGEGDPARSAVETALRLGRPVVTANKALVAAHGRSLADLAERHGAPLLFEAAVMGGTPAVKMLREALVGAPVQAVAGILNGTCNFILTRMEASGRSFEEVLQEAQALGYAEADPRADIGGFDAAHKIAILAALAFGCAPTPPTEVEGVEDIQALDIRLARDLGFRIKLIASAVQSASGPLVRVHPALVPLDHPLARTDGALNALFISGPSIGRIFVEGPGAGAGPTAAAVAADIADIMTGAVRPVFQRPANALGALTNGRDEAARAEIYLRLLVRDEPGVIAAVSETLAAAGVSIDSFLQKHVEGASGVPIVLITHEAAETALERAVQAIEALPSMLSPPRVIRVARI